MQALIPVFAFLGVAAGARLTLLPYAYLADPLPVYHQSQDTRAGVHAYSYAGGPSAKEEVRGPDGVTRGSYSYVDAHGILQSVFYVADEGGFRVAATNLPSDGDLPVETGEVLLARNAHLLEHARAAAAAAAAATAEQHSRRKRSPEAPIIDQDPRQTENPSSQGSSAPANPEIASPKSSHELPAPEKNVDKARAVLAPVYGLVDSALIPRLTGAATSHQSRVDIHNNIRLKAVQPVETIGVLSHVEPAYETVILPSQVPLATSHQSRLQVHNNLRVEVPEKLVVKNAETSGVQPQALPAAAAVALEPLPLVAALSDYNQNRIQLHKAIGLEGPNPKDTVKIDAPQVALVETPLPAVPLVAKEAVPILAKEAVPILAKEAVPILAKEAVPILAKEALPVIAKEALPVVGTPIVAVPVLAKETIPVITKEALPVATAVSSQSRTQLHRNTKLEVAVPIVSEPAVYVATSYVQPIATWPILTPIAQSSQYRSQIYSNEKIKLAK